MDKTTSNPSTMLSIGKTPTQAETMQEESRETSPPQSVCMLTLAEPSFISTDIEQAGSSSQDAPRVVPTTEVEELRCRARRLTRDFLGNLERLELNAPPAEVGDAGGAEGAAGAGAELALREVMALRQRVQAALEDSAAEANALSLKVSRYGARLGEPQRLTM